MTRRRPVDRQGERLADADVVERLLAHVEAQVLERQRGDGTQGRPQVRVVADPCRVVAAQARVVDLAVDERRQRTLAPERRDEIHRRDGRRARPVVGIRLEDELVLGLRPEEVAAAGDLPVGRPGRDDPERGLATMAGNSLAGCDSRTSTSEPDAVSPTVVGSALTRCRKSFAPTTSPMSDARGDGCGRIDDPHPAPDDISRRDRRPVREGQAGSQVEDDPPPAVEHIPRLGPAPGEARGRGRRRSGSRRSGP